MNICFVCHGYPPAERVGGIEVFTKTLAQGLAFRGHNVSVVGFTKGLTRNTEENDQDVQVFRLALGQPIRGISALTRRVRLEAALRRIIREQTCDLVECPDVGGSLLFGHLGALLTVRLHGANNLVYRPSTGRKPNRLGVLFEKQTLRLADELVAVSQYIRDVTLDAAKLSNRPCEIIYNGINTHVFKPDPNVSRDSNRILFVGRLSETKGAPNLFAALPAVFSRFPAVYLRFVGKDPVDSFSRRSSDILLSKLPEQFRSRVEFAGEMSHEKLAPEYQSAGVAVFPSRAESWGIAICEAMACGTPVVFMNRGPGPEMIKHGSEGLLCDTDSPEAIADSISELLLHPEHARQMGVNAARRVASTLSLESAIDRNEQFYQNLLTGKRAQA